MVALRKKERKPDVSEILLHSPREQKTIFSVQETCGPSPTELWTPSFGDLLPVEGWKGVWDGSESALLPPESRCCANRNLSPVHLCYRSVISLLWAWGRLRGRENPAAHPCRAGPCMEELQEPTLLICSELCHQKPPCEGDSDDFCQQGDLGCGTPPPHLPGDRCVLILPLQLAGEEERQES